MKIAKIILLFLALLLTNCSGELEQEYGLMPPAPGQVNPEKPDVPLNKNDAFQKVQKRRVQEKR